MRSFPGLFPRSLVIASRHAMTTVCLLRDSNPWHARVLVLLDPLSQQSTVGLVVPTSVVSTKQSHERISRSWSFDQDQGWPFTLVNCSCFRFHAWAIRNSRLPLHYLQWFPKKQSHERVTGSNPKGRPLWCSAKADASFLPLTHVEPKIVVVGKDAVKGYPWCWTKHHERRICSCDCFVGNTEPPVAWWLSGSNKVFQSYQCSILWQFWDNITYGEYCLFC